jgi:LysR family transcriptional regulator, nitrogen assimilation regulatory protein
VKIVELGSMTRAAEQLNVAQPALGLQMRQLEQELGVILLQRHSRGVVPTTAGQLLCERCHEILDLVERTAREVSTFSADAVETVRLGLTPSLMQLVASDLLVRARLELPLVLLRLVEEMSFVLLDALGRRDLDMALAYDVPDQPGLRRTAWLREEVLFVTAPGPGEPANSASPQGIVGTITFEDALQAELALAGSRDPLRQMVAEAAEQLSIVPRVTFEVQSVQAMKILVGDGLAASIMPYGSAAAELTSGRLVGRRIIQPRLTRTLYLVTNPKFDELRGGAALLKMLDTTRERILRILDPLGQPIGPSVISRAPRR